MNLNLLILNNTSNLKEFISFWSNFYTYKLDNLYYDSIDKKVFDMTDIQNLYIWKNGMKLSKLKQTSIDTKIKSKLSIINKFKQSNSLDIEMFKEVFKDVSAVWKIFLLHIIKPSQYPIYDQHIHRAYNFINDLEYHNISSDMSNKNKEEFYFITYLPFIQSLNIKNIKKFDEALFMFGQFINKKEIKNN